MPGDDLYKIQKAISLDVDCICMDLEDGVAENCKQNARVTIVKALESLDFGRSERLVRINPTGSRNYLTDLEAVLPAHPDGIVVPKVGTADQLLEIDSLISQVEQNHGWAPGSICMLALIETARGVINLKEISGASTRLQALIFGAEDLAGDIGAVRTRPGWEIFYARSAVVTHAAAFGLQALDMVFMDLHNIAELVAESQEAARLAYSGKQIIHPRQVGPVQESFTPSQEAVADAARIISAAESKQAEGIGAFSLDGRMIDGPVVRAAEWVIRRAAAAGKYHPTRG